MYLINKNENKIEKVAERTFSELGFKSEKIFKNGLRIIQIVLVKTY